VIPRPFDVSANFDFRWALHYATSTGDLVVPALTASFATGCQGHIAEMDPVDIAQVASISPVGIKRTVNEESVNTQFCIPTGLFEVTGMPRSRVVLAPILSKYRSDSVGNAPSLYSLPEGHSVKHALVLATLMQDALSLTDPKSVCLAFKKRTGYSFADWYTEEGDTTMQIVMRHGSHGPVECPGKDEVWIVAIDTKDTVICTGLYIGAAIEDKLAMRFKDWKVIDEGVQVSPQDLYESASAQLVHSDVIDANESAEACCALAHLSRIYDKAIYFGDTVFPKAQVESSMDGTLVEDTPVASLDTVKAGTQSLHQFVNGYACLLIEAAEGTDLGEVMKGAQPIIEIEFVKV
jgi:hypothetical protein